MKKLSQKLQLLLLAALIPAFSTAQDEEQQVFELSPFEVNTDEDIGYLATNTLAGTRINASLRDTAASISVWTPEFLEDTGFTDIEELVLYSANSVVDTGDAGPGGFFNTFTNAANVTPVIRTRGIPGSKGIDYFKAIIPNDSYRVGRYDDARGPNGVLFGVSSTGGLINQSSLHANLFRNSGRLRYSFGSNERNRAEFRHNQVLLDDKLAVVVAGLYQDNGHWRDFASDEKERIYTALKWQINKKISLRVNFEDGFEHETTVQPTAPMDEGLPFLDNLMAFGVEAVTFTPTGGNPNNTMRALGVTSRESGQNRPTYAVNDGFLYDATRTFRTDGYNDAQVRHPDGTPGLGGDRIRINDLDFMPMERFLPGPDHFRETDFDMYAAFLDVELTKDWYLNVQAAAQSSDIQTYSLAGPRPELYGEPNLTRGINGPANPYAGRMYLDGEWRNDTSLNQFREFRASTSYHLDTESKWLGRHQIAVSVARTDESQQRNQKELVMGGNPAGRGTFVDRQGNRYTNSDYGDGRHQIQIRNYIDLNDYSTWKAGSWRDLPDTLTTDIYTGTPTEYPVVWAYDTPGNLNFMADFTTKSYLAVTQSYFFNDRFVVTLGYRKDELDITRFGHRRDPIVGWLPDKTVLEDTEATNDVIPASPKVNYSGNVRTTGLVFHVTDWLSLIANEASSIEPPDFRRTVFPDGRNASPADGNGRDFGIAFSFLENRINGRLVYYETERLGDASGASEGRREMENIYDALEDYLTGAALEELLSRRLELRPEVNGKISDDFSEGIELRLTANLTRNWRLNLNVAKTDRLRQNSFGPMIEYLGLRKGDDGELIQGATPSNLPGGEYDAYEIDPSAYTSDGIVADFLELANELPEGRTIQNTGISEFLYDMVDRTNERIRDDEKRWGLRPWRFNIFTAYDFKDGLLDGWTIGGGYRWTDANIIGELPDGTEIDGEPRAETDFFVRYQTDNFSFSKNGRWTFQLNIYNVFDDRSIIPGPLGGSEDDPDLRIPGGRGVAYQRFDVVPPREFRFTVTYDY